MNQNTDVSPDAAREASREPALVPAVNVHEDASGITLYADLPGVSRERLSVEVDGDTLSIEGELALELPDGLEPSYAEVGRRRYRRVFTLSKELDRAKVSAALNQGVLTLRIPKVEHAQPRRVEVRVS
ncbi:MAG: Hsp20/alpha crystallin family protein [Chromatiales bacterium]|nr:Hsp20/alpha crystallin family protein [Chromatiales bacterium]